MRKPDLCFFQHVIAQTGLRPAELLMIDDTAENICAARSLGMQGLLMDNDQARKGGALRNLFQDPLRRAEAFMKANARNLHCVVEGRSDIVLKDNFAQLLIWDLTGDSEIIYLKYPSGEQHDAANHANSTQQQPLDPTDVKPGLWNYFYETPVLTTPSFPADADTTSIAYLTLPTPFLSKLAPIPLILSTIASNLDTSGLAQTYFCSSRPRTTPEVCCNIVRLFHRFGHGSDPRIAKTEDWVVSCLENKACLDGSRHYTTPEGFLYFVARLYAECSETLRARLEAPVRAELRERIGVPANPLALALRVAACRLVGIGYGRDLGLLMALQDVDGGWPAGHFCRMGRTGTRIGNRGLTTALAMSIIRGERAGV